MKNNAKYSAAINDKYCKIVTCRICAGICPVDNLLVRNNRIVDSGNCNGCGLCENYCPEMAIKIEKVNL